ncbi:P-loop containing nucleoside triphosphate hydrolase protein [Backusella circina FSU 941]|nr:P-loop containing nucleoside triphosphate hydrolase protein [Backusella circina FSU 941]
MLSALGASAVFAPAVILALPFIGAYEFGRARDDELLSGKSVVSAVVGGLFGVIVSPLAPLYCFIISMEEILGYNAKKKSISKKYLNRADSVIRLDFSYYNVAITGSPGTGKSSLLNGLLGYKNTHNKAATVGETETTMAPKKYHHPIVHSLVLWDMPGIGTPSHPIKTYFERYCLGAFDAVLIVFDERLMASDVELARKAALYDIPVFFIRNKSDLVK